MNEIYTLSNVRYFERFALLIWVARCWLSLLKLSVHNLVYVSHKVSAYCFLTGYKHHKLNPLIHRNVFKDNIYNLRNSTGVVMVRVLTSSAADRWSN